ncbi:hypothetical protein M8818_000927 [Zalaria obscura]|uniref:Uncharacterized protein n=1 Tax=Zalaria obscura TaxID=2024903 RepID=A0ACC3SM78_9PEZI
MFPLLLSLLTLLPSVLGYASPLSCSGTCTNTHDPSLIRRSSDGKYYRFATGAGIAIHTASSIQGPWTYQGYALPSGSKVDNSGADDLWVRVPLPSPPLPFPHISQLQEPSLTTSAPQAPDVHQIGSTYYLYYSASAFGTQTSVLGLATSSTMDPGSWTDHGSIGVSSTSAKPYNAIDANLVPVGSTYLLNFGSFWHDIYQVPMATVPTRAGGASYNIAYNSSGDHGIEGSYMVQQGNYYYLFFSSGQCCGYDTERPAPGGEYKIMVCRSSSATGGFVDQNGASCTNGGGTVVLQSHGIVYGPGGQGVYEDPEVGWVVY